MNKNERYFECDMSWLQQFSGDLIYTKLLQDLGESHVMHQPDNPTVFFRSPTDNKIYVVVPLGMINGDEITNEMLSNTASKELYDSLGDEYELLVWPVYLNLKRKSVGLFYINDINKLKFHFEEAIHMVDDAKLKKLMGDDVIQ